MTNLDRQSVKLFLDLSLYLTHDSINKVYLMAVMILNGDKFLVSILTQKIAITTLKKNGRFLTLVIKSHYRTALPEKFICTNNPFKK